MKNSVTLYRKLRDFLAIQINHCSVEQRTGRCEQCRFDIVRWMPKLEELYRRLTYAEFCTAYNLEMISV